MAASEWQHTFAKARPRMSRLAGPVLLFLICAGFFWKIVLTNQYTWLEGPDLANQVLPWFQFQAGEWHRGRIPLWDPYQWGGQSLIGQAQPGVAYPLNWILFLLPSAPWLDAPGLPALVLRADSLHGRIVRLPAVPRFETVPDRLGRRRLRLRAWAAGWGSPTGRRC